MSKVMEEARKQVDREKVYPLSEAAELLKTFPGRKFDETIDLALNFDVDRTKAEQIVRGTVVLPHGTGRDVRIVVLAKGDAAKRAEEAGALEVGAEELVEKIAGGWVDYDAVVAAPDLMSEVGKLGKVLGPRGLMPTPKAGTVTPDVDKAVADLKKGKVEFKMDKQGDIHLGVGKKSFAADAIAENVAVVMESIWKARPAAVKGQYLKGAVLSTTMGPGVRIDPAEGRDA